MNIDLYQDRVQIQIISGMKSKSGSTFSICLGMPFSIAYLLNFFTLVSETSSRMFDKPRFCPRETPANDLSDFHTTFHKCCKAQVSSLPSDHGSLSGEDPG